MQKWMASHTDRLTPVNNSGTLWIGGWVAAQSRYERNGE
jgi:hypothetical protein